MKKILLWCGMAAVMPVVMAVRPGGQTVELDEIRWVQRGPVKLVPEKRPEPGEPRFQAVTFLLTRAPNSDASLELLEHLRRTYGSQVNFVLITPDDRADLDTLLARHPGFPLAIGLDAKRKVTPAYMEGSLLYPMTFLFDEKGNLLWNGETIDLAETIDKCLTDRFDRKNAMRIAPMIDEMESLLRENNDRRMQYLTDSVLKIDPGNAAALRLRLFALENSGRNAEAWKLIEEQLNASPTLERLYFSAVDVAGNHPALEPKIAETVNRYIAAVRNNPDSNNLMAWTLLARRAEDPVALRQAFTLVAQAKAALPADAKPAMRAALATTEALLEYRLGRPERALALQEPLPALWEKANLAANAEAAKKRIEFYREVVALSKQQ